MKLTTRKILGETLQYQKFSWYNKRMMMMHIHEYSHGLLQHVLEKMVSKAVAI